MTKIDCKNKFVKIEIEKTKELIKREILDCFECNIYSLYLGEIMGDNYYIIVNYIVKKNIYGLPKDFCFVTKIAIPEKEYKEWSGVEK